MKDNGYHIMDQKLKNILKCFIPFFVYMGAYFVVMFFFAFITAGETHGDLKATEELFEKYALLITLILDGLLIVVFLLMWRIDRKSFPLKKADMPAISWAFLTLIGAAGCVALNYLLQLTMPSEILDTYNETGKTLWNPATKWISLLCVGIVAPICEELMFRGLIYTRMRLLMKGPYVILITAILFGVFHGNALQFLYALLLGLILAYVMETYHSIAAPILLHMSANLISWLLTYEVLIPSDNGGVLDWSVLGGTMLIVITGLFSIVYTRKRKRAKREEQNE